MPGTGSFDVDEPWAELIGRAQAGDERAFTQIWRRHQPALLRYLEVVIGRHGAEDVAADTWLSIVRALPRFRGDETGFKALVFTTARSRIVDGARRAKARPQLAADLGLEQLDALDPRQARTGDDITSEVERAEATRAALSLIACLPPGQAEVVALRVIGGLDNGEVAQITGKRAGAVRAAYSRGVASLAQMVDVGGRVTDPDELAFW